MSRSALALLSLIAAAAAIAGFFGWRHLQRLEGEVTALRGTVVALGTDLQDAEEQARSSAQRADEAEERSARGEALALRLAERAEAAEGEAAAASRQAIADRVRATMAAADAELAGQARQAADQRSADALLKAEQAFLEAERAKREAREMRQRREQELDRLARALDQIAATRRTALGLVMDLGDSIEFDFDRAELRPQNRELLARIAGVLMTAEDFAIQVYGHTDDVGGVAYNQQLSERRASAVREYLVATGVDPQVISRVGYGKSRPLVEGTDPQARQRNRR
ncbi:MAG TPA: OmpA family protein, partial [Thermoanaerobaculia bacterium]|nr:OmpA family protein [Thermoanaerobaculia bacterium]